MAKKEKVPHELRGQAILEDDCPSCGHTVALKVNVNGSVYRYCMRLLPSGKRCTDRHTYSGEKSAQLIHDYLESCKDGATENRRESVEQDEYETETPKPVTLARRAGLPANDNEPDKPARRAGGGSVFPWLD